MTTTLVRGVATAAFSVLMLALLNAAFHLMNQPSDRKFYEGIAMVLLIVLVAPIVLSLVWKGRI